MPPDSEMAYNDEIKRTNSEIWTVKLSSSDMVAWLRQRLPVWSTNRDVGVPWACDDPDHTKGDFKEWIWSGDVDTSVGTVSGFFRARVDDNDGGDPGLVEFQRGGDTWPS